MGNNLFPKDLLQRRELRQDSLLSRPGVSMPPIYLPDESDHSCRQQQISAVELIDIGDDLEQGVRTKSMKEMPETTRPAIKEQYYIKKVSIKDGVFDVKIESELSTGDLGNSYEPFLIIHSGGVELLGTGLVRIKLDSFYRACQFAQTFTFRATDSSPYIQLLCNVNLKNNGICFKRGDLITLLFRDVLSESFPPIPPLLSVIPDKLTYVPMIPNQLLQIITLEKEQLGWCRNPESCFEFKTGGIISHPRFLAEKQRHANYYFCKKHLHQAEVFSSSNAMVVVPPTSQPYTRFALIDNPPSSFLLYCCNIDGFVIRTPSHAPITAPKHERLRLEYVSHGKDCSESKICFEFPLSYVVVQCYDEGWSMKSF